MVSRLVVGLVAWLAVVGCVHPNRIEEHHGEAQGELVRRMVENPEAEQAPAAGVEGLDPITGEALMGKYEEQQGESKEPGQGPSIIQIESGGSR
jgi:hypothetical protein